MTSDEWAEVENALTWHNSCNLTVDSYQIRLSIMPYSATKNVIFVLIDGKILTNYCMEDCDIRRRFCQPHKHSLLSAAEKKKLKREQKAVREEVEKMTTYYSYLPWWSSFRSLKAHFMANNKEIKIGG